jgi:hypothetical protein
MTDKTTRKTAARLKASVAVLAIALQLAAQIGPAAAFCGFYVAQADSKLFNKSSKVVLARDGNQTAITMASDYEGEPKEFAVVIPVPTFIERKQIGVVETKTINHLDAYTAPRLVEYYDEDPCRTIYPMAVASPQSLASAGMPKTVDRRRSDYATVTVEATYDVGEYDISILSAQESDGLVQWLTDNGYRIPAGAEGVLASYIKQKMRFFVAKVNLERMQVLGNAYLRPLQVRYESAKFMLPLRLGTVNAKGPQDLIIYALSRNGRVETELPDRQAAVRRGRAAVREGRLRHVLQGSLRAGRAQRGYARRVHRICLGHGLVRPLRLAAARQQGARRAWRALGRLRRRSGRPVRRQQCLRDAPARALRRGAFPGRPRADGDA